MTYIKLCKDCFHCKILKDKKHVKCEVGYYDFIELNKIKLFTPNDFDCIEWDGYERY